jgi:hypothetical protein
MKSKTRQAEEKILKALRKHGIIKLRKLTSKHPDLPITFGLWNLRTRGEIKRKARGEYVEA